jgi:hypothetical protein
LRDLGRNDEAVAAFDRAEDLGGWTPRIGRERGLALATLYRAGVPALGEEPPAELETWRARGELDLARALDSGVSAAPTPDLVFAEGLLAWLQGADERAVVKLREVVEMDLTHQDAHLALSKLYLVTGQADLGMRHSVIATDLLRGNRQAYVARARPGSAEGLEPHRELDGMRELLVDFALLMQLEAGNLNGYGLRGQVQLRDAMRAFLQGDAQRARTHLAHAIREHSAALELRSDYYAALIGRAAARAQLARVLDRAGDPEGAAASAGRALSDYDAVLGPRPALSVARYDRALLHAFRGDDRAALEDARVALSFADEDHPWRSRFESLVGELEAVLK